MDSSHPEAGVSCFASMTLSLPSSASLLRDILKSTSLLGKSPSPSRSIHEIASENHLSITDSTPDNVLLPSDSDNLRCQSNDASIAQSLLPRHLSIGHLRRPSLKMRASRTAALTELDYGPVFLLPILSRKPPVSNSHRPVPRMTADKDGSRRSHLRRIMNAIIRRRNEVNPSEIKDVESQVGRFDANSLHGEHSDVPGDVEDSNPGPNPGKARKRVLILMSDTGGGHRASAEALKETFQLEYGDKYEIAIVDAWKDHTPFPFNQMPKSYSFLVKHENLWRMAFYATKPRFVHQPQMAATSAFVGREFAKMLDIHRPDIIVSVHPLMQHIPLRVLRSRGLLHRIPFTTVITDLTTCHPTWFHKSATTCFCPTKEVAQRALKAGLTPPQLRVHGLPVRPAFSKPPSKSQVELRRDIGLDPVLPTALLIGGGEGMGPVEATAKALASTIGSEGEKGPRGQLIVVCGRNKKLKEKLEAVKWPMPVQVRGFVTNMADVMAACNCIITKAGPGTIAESLIRGLPLVLNDFIAGQEVGNVPYVVDNGAGVFCEDPKKTGRIVADWFGAKAEEFAQMAENAKMLARPDAVFRIVRDLDHLACGERLMVQRELALV